MVKKAEFIIIVLVIDKIGENVKLSVIKPKSFLELLFFTLFITLFLLYTQLVLT